MYLKSLEISGFKSFAKKSTLEFNCPISAIVGPNGSGKSNVAEAFRFVLGEQSIKSLRGKRGEDLIFNGSKDGSRTGRAGVKVVFDNRQRMLNIDFDEVSIERQVFRDGVNSYSLNGTEVRLRDIIELLAGAHIGASGHHIISQGEADKILNSNLRERRSMIEDALGLKIYQYKKEESEKKLEKTEENIKQVESLRREIAPHIKFLRKQVEKIEKAASMKDELKSLYKEYFKREELYLRHEKDSILKLKHGPEIEKKSLDTEVLEIKDLLSQNEKRDARSDELVSLEGKLQKVRSDMETTSRDMGRIEGEISYLERNIKKQKEEESREANIPVFIHEVESLATGVENKISEIEKSDDISFIKDTVFQIGKSIREFISHKKTKKDESAVNALSNELQKSIEEKNILQKKIGEIKNEERNLNDEYGRLKSDIEKGKDTNLEAEKRLLKIMTRQNEIQNELSNLRMREERIVSEEEEWKREFGEAGMMLGREITEYPHVMLLNNEGISETDDEALREERSIQIERRRRIEKLKIRLEDAGVGGSDETMKEFKDAEERDSFLEKELNDLGHSALSLQTLIAELGDKLDFEFKEGVKKINEEFTSYFRLMFGGGQASLEVVREKVRRKRIADDLLENAEAEVDFENNNEEVLGDEGIDISVQLPHKKTKGLMMLSGGERALSSIALLFAISRVNPPPFIILDETDAALDEANSRKYGDMIESLSKHSQLILITHNRETMSRAGIIYGITMGADGASRLLSIQFDEAVATAK